jgi:DNA-directed RNA polymerase specialized sigma24 family protein
LAARQFWFIICRTAKAPCRRRPVSSTLGVMKPLVYRGITYNTVMELYRAAQPEDMSYMCLRQRLAKGWDVDKALSTPVLAAWRRTYSVDGKTYTSLKSLAEAACITYMQAVKRAQRGWTDAEIFFGREKAQEPAPKHPPKGKEPKGKPVIVQGREYPNIQTAYKALKPTIPLNSARQRLRRGASIEEALGITSRPDGRTTRVRDKSIEIDGERMTSSQAALKFDVPVSTVRDRKARGATDRQAVGLDPISEGDLLTQTEAYAGGRKQQPRESVQVAGVNYPTIRALAKAYGLSYPLVYNRIKTYGWDPERAVSEQVAAPVEVDGKSYRSALAAWNVLGETAFSVFSFRRKKGYSLRVSLGLDPVPTKERYEVQGEAFASLEEVSDRFSVPVGHLQSRLKRMNIEEAVVYKPIVGRYTEAKFAADPELASRLGTLYFVKIAARDGELHKIGITARSIAERFSKSDHVVLAYWPGTLLDLYRIEQQVLGLFGENHYRAEEDFDGRTETFVFLPHEERDVIRVIDRAIVAFMPVDSSRQAATSSHDA